MLRNTTNALNLDYYKHALTLNLGCAYKRGICSMCGKQILDVKNYVQSTV